MRNSFLNSRVLWHWVHNLKIYNVKTTVYFLFFFFMRKSSFISWILLINFSFVINVWISIHLKLHCCSTMRTTHFKFHGDLGCGSDYRELFFLSQFLNNKIRNIIINLKECLHRNMLHTLCQLVQNRKNGDYLVNRLRKKRTPNYKKYRY